MTSHRALGAMLATAPGLGQPAVQGGDCKMSNLNQALDGMASTLVLLFTIPIVGAVVAAIIADTNTSTTDALIVCFIGTIYSLGVLIFCVRNFIGSARSQ